MKALKISVIALIALLVLAGIAYLIAVGVYTALEQMTPHSCPATGACPQPKLF